MNRRGFLLAEETLKIIIAVICIGFLAVFLASLYFNSQTSKELEFAETSLNHLVGELGEGVEEIEIYNPVKWVVVSWPKDFKAGGFLGIGTHLEEGIPNSCSNVGWESCICICKKDNPDECDKNGVCLEESFFVGEKGAILIKNPPVVLSVDYENQKVVRKENES